MSASSVFLMLLAVGGMAVVSPVSAKSVEDHAALRVWTRVFVDAKTKKPLAGILIDAHVAIPEKSEPQDRLLVSDASGAIKFSLRQGECTSLNIRGPGWCFKSGFPFVGDLPEEWRDAKYRAADPHKVITIELHQGTEVRGRLLLPDGAPAADVSLIAGVHCGGEPWLSKEQVEGIMSRSYSTAEWPNWQARTVTDKDGTFSITVPPVEERGWLRIGTTQGGWSAIDTDALEKNNKQHPLIRYAPFEVEINGDQGSRQIDESAGVVELGDLQLSKGIVLHGRVLDAESKPLAGVHLFTSSARGPLAGRKTVSQADGTFEFRPMNQGSFRLTPDAHFRDDQGQKNSRDVQALFVCEEVTLSEKTNPQELIVKAQPHIELAFAWVDRRAEKGSVSYYGGFTLTGEVARANGSKAWWQGKTVKVTRGNKEFLVVKVPESVIGLKIALHHDDKVTPSYHDDQVEQATGQVELGDIKQELHRVIYADEP